MSKLQLPPSGFLTYTDYARQMGISLPEVTEYLAAHPEDQKFVKNPGEVLDFLKQDRIKRHAFDPEGFRPLEGNTEKPMMYDEIQKDSQGQSFLQDTASSALDVAGGALAGALGTGASAWEAGKNFVVDPLTAPLRQGVRGALDFGGGDLIGGAKKVATAPAAAFEELFGPVGEALKRGGATFADAHKMMIPGAPGSNAYPIVAGALSAVEPAFDPFVQAEDAIQERYTRPIKESVGLDPDIRNRYAETAGDVALSLLTPDLADAPELLAKEGKPITDAILSGVEALKPPKPLTPQQIRLTDLINRVKRPDVNKATLGGYYSDIRDLAEAEGHQFRNIDDFIGWVDNQYMRQPQRGAWNMGWQPRPGDPGYEGSPRELAKMKLNAAGAGKVRDEAQRQNVRDFISSAPDPEAMLEPRSDRWFDDPVEKVSGRRDDSNGMRLGAEDREAVAVDLEALGTRDYEREADRLEREAAGEKDRARASDMRAQARILREERDPESNSLIDELLDDRVDRDRDLPFEPDGDTDDSGSLLSHDDDFPVRGRKSNARMPSYDPRDGYDQGSSLEQQAYRKLEQEEYAKSRGMTANKRGDFEVYPTGKKDKNGEEIFDYRRDDKGQLIPKRADVWKGGDKPNWPEVTAERLSSDPKNAGRVERLTEIAADRRAKRELDKAGAISDDVVSRVADKPKEAKAAYDVTIGKFIETKKRVDAARAAGTAPNAQDLAEMEGLGYRLQELGIARLQHMRENFKSASPEAQAMIQAEATKIKAALGRVEKLTVYGDYVPKKRLPTEPIPPARPGTRKMEPLPRRKESPEAEDWMQRMEDRQRSERNNLRDGVHGLNDPDSEAFYDSIYGNDTRSGPSFNGASSPEAGAVRPDGTPLRRGKPSERGAISPALVSDVGKLGKRVVAGTKDLLPSVGRLVKETVNAEDWAELKRFLANGEVELPLDRLRAKLREAKPGSPQADKIEAAIREVEAAVQGPNEFLASVKTPGRGEINKGRRGYEHSYKPQKAAVKDMGSVGEVFHERNFNRKRDATIRYQQIMEDIKEFQNWAPERQRVLRDVREKRLPLTALDPNEQDMLQKIGKHLDTIGSERVGKLEDRIPAFNENVHSLVSRLPKYNQELVMKAIAGKLTPTEMADIRKNFPLAETIIDAIHQKTGGNAADISLWFSNAKQFPDDPRYVLKTDERWVPTRQHPDFFPHEQSDEQLLAYGRGADDFVSHRRAGGTAGGQIRLGQETGDDAPANILARYFETQTDRLAQYEHFGLTGNPQSWNKQFAKFADAAAKSHTAADAAVIQMVMKREFNDVYKPGDTRRAFHQGIRAGETALKLPKAAIQNFFAMWPRMNEFGVGNAFKAFLADKNLKEEARRYMHSFYQEHQNYFLEGVDPKASLISETVNKAADTTMKFSFFRTVEEFNRKQSAIAGLLWSDEALQNLKAGKYSGAVQDDVVKRLKEMGVSPEAFADGVLRPGDRHRIAYTASDITEFGQGGWNKPLLMEATPELRTATQFLGWGASAWQLEARHLTRAFETGRWTPFIVGTAMSGVTGMLFQDVADVASGRRPTVLEAGDKLKAMKRDWLRISSGDVTPSEFVGKWGLGAAYRFTMGLMAMSRAAALSSILRGGAGGKVDFDNIEARVPKGPALSDPFALYDLADGDDENDYYAKRRLTALYSIAKDAKHVPLLNIPAAAIDRLMGGEGKVMGMKHNPRNDEGFDTLLGQAPNPWETDQGGEAVPQQNSRRGRSGRSSRGGH